MAVRLYCDRVSKDISLDDDLSITSVESFSGRTRNFMFYDYEHEHYFLPYHYAMTKCLDGLLPDIRRSYINIEFNGTLLEKQVKHAENALKQLITKGTSMLCLYTSAGKTVIGAWLACQLKTKVAVVFSGVDTLTPQWKATFETFTNAKVTVVEIKSKMKKVDLDADVFLCPVTRIKNLPGEVRESIGLLILDEADTLCTKTGRDLLLFEPKYILAETATPDRDDGQSVMLEHLCGPERIEVPYPDPYTVYCVRTRISYPVYMNGRKPDWTRIVNDISGDVNRDQLFNKILDKHKNEKVMIFTLRKEHAKALAESLRTPERSTDFFLGGKKTYKSSDVLICTVPKVGRGFDEKMFCSADFDGTPTRVAIISESIKSIPRLQQLIGRCFRAKDPLIYDFVDDNPIVENHWRIRKDWYESNGGTVKEFKLFNDAPCEVIPKLSDDDNHRISSRIPWGTLLGSR